jgi:hypothetical protein
VNARSFLSLFTITALSIGLSRCESAPTGSGDVSPPVGSVNVVAGNNQAGLVGDPLNIRPAVRVTDAGGSPVSGRSVTFVVASGGGSVTPTNLTTNGNGVVQVSSWILGTVPGANTLTVTVSGTGILANPVTFTATGLVSTFNITIQNVGPPFTQPVQDAFDSAAASWQRIIFQDIADIPNFNSPADACFAGQPAIGPVFVDDILILAKVDSIDGPSGILGQAGPCFLRATGHLPLVGTMVFDSADMAMLTVQGQLRDAIRHEMGHVLGFGTLWNDAPQINCLQLASIPPATVLDTYFSCAHGRAAFDSLGGTAYTGGNKVPVENCGPASPPGCGGGTVDAHWREPTFGPELMTGYLNSGVANPLSVLSVAAMEDLGYVVAYAAANPYTRTFSLLAGASRQAARLALGDDVRHGSIYVVGAGGRIVRVIPAR